MTPDLHLRTFSDEALAAHLGNTDVQIRMLEEMNTPDQGDREKLGKLREQKTQIETEMLRRRLARPTMDMGLRRPDPIEVANAEHEGTVTFQQALREVPDGILNWLRDQDPQTLALLADLGPDIAMAAGDLLRTRQADAQRQRKIEFGQGRLTEPRLPRIPVSPDLNVHPKEN